MAEPAHPILNGRAGGVGSFLLRSSPQVSARAVGETTVLARVGDSDALVAYEDPITGARTLTQLSPAFVETGTHDFPQRRKLLRNAVGWLTRTTSPTAASEVSFQTFVVPPTAVWGPVFWHVLLFA